MPNPTHNAQPASSPVHQHKFLPLTDKKYTTPKPTNPSGDKTTGQNGGEKKTAFLKLN